MKELLPNLARESNADNEVLSPTQWSRVFTEMRRTACSSACLASCLELSKSTVTTILSGRIAEVTYFKSISRSSRCLF